MHRDNKSPVSVFPADDACAVLTVQQLAQTLQVSPVTIRRLHAAGVLPFAALRIGRRLLFPMAAVNGFLAASPASKN